MPLQQVLPRKQAQKPLLVKVIKAIQPVNLPMAKPTLLAVNQQAKQGNLPAKLGSPLVKRANLPVRPVNLLEKEHRLRVISPLHRVALPHRPRKLPQPKRYKLPLATSPMPSGLPAKEPCKSPVRRRL